MARTYEELVEEHLAVPRFGIIRTFPAEMNLAPEMVIDPIPYDAPRFFRLVNAHGGDFNKVPVDEPTGMVDCGCVKIVPGIVHAEPKPATPASEGYDWSCGMTQWTMEDNKFVRAQTWDMMELNTEPPTEEV